MGTWSSTTTTTRAWGQQRSLATVPESLASSGNRLTGSSGAVRRPYGVVTDIPATRGQWGQPHSPENANDGSSSASNSLWPSEDDHPVLRRQRVEAVLLLSKSPLSTRKLAQLAHLADATEARTLVRELNQVFDEKHRALRVELVAGGYRLMTRPALAPWLTRLGHLPPATRLSSPMMETLAVVAYRQPVSRVNVEAIRGVACGELLRQLMERDLIRIAGRAEELGRPYLYGTTKRFLQIFGLANTEALPPIQWHALQDDTHDDLQDDLHDGLQTEDPPQEELSTPTKESVVSTTAAPVVLDAESEISIVTPIAADSTVESQDPAAVIEDEEDDLYEGTGDFADDADDEDDDWDDADDEDDEDWDDEEDEDDDDELEDDEWKEVDDEDDDLDDDADDDVDDVDDDEFDDEEDDWDDEDDDEWDDDEEDEAADEDDTE